MQRDDLVLRDVGVDKRQRDVRSDDQEAGTGRRRCVGPRRRRSRVTRDPRNDRDVRPTGLVGSRAATTDGDRHGQRAREHDASRAVIVSRKSVASRRGSVAAGDVDEPGTDVMTIAERTTSGRSRRSARGRPRSRGCRPAGDERGELRPIAGGVAAADWLGWHRRGSPRIARRGVRRTERDELWFG